MSGRLGEFELDSLLAHGGMADLYLARSPRFPGPVVLKVLQARYAVMPEVAQRFADEARIATALDHPNIVRALAAGRHDDTRFIVLEHVVGCDLGELTRRAQAAGRRLPLHLAAVIVEQLAAGLAHAHGRRGADGAPFGIVHCDLSPGNVVVSVDGAAKILDFGVARASFQTGTLPVAGQLGYMAPEQIRGEAVDARADLFSLGVMLYELSLERRLFGGRPEQALYQTLNAPIAPPSAIAPHFPEPLEAIILRALEREPMSRYPTAERLGADLEAWLHAAGHRDAQPELAWLVTDLLQSAGGD